MVGSQCLQPFVRCRNLLEGPRRRKLDGTSKRFARSSTAAPRTGARQNVSLEMRMLEPTDPVGFPTPALCTRPWAAVTIDELPGRHRKECPDSSAFRAR